MIKESVLILGVNRSGTTSLCLNLAKQIGKSIIEPWGHLENIDSYPIPKLCSDHNTVLKSITHQKPRSYVKDVYYFLLELIDFFGINNTILISRKNFYDQVFSYSNLMYSGYEFRKYLKETGKKNYSLIKNPLRNWSEKDLPEWYINDEKIQYTLHKHIDRRRELLFKLSSELNKEIVWYEDLYGEDRNLSLSIINSWNLNIDNKKLNEDLNPKFRYRKTNKSRLL